MEKELVEHIAKALAKHPDEVLVTLSENDKGTLLKLAVAEDDLGRVIGKQGRIAKAIRTILSAGATGSGKRVSLEIID